MASAPFENRVTLVTGASSGIGAALAERFAEQRARLALVARRRDRLESLAAQLAARGAPAPVVIEADLCAAGAVDEVVRAATAQLGPVEVLVNNAGVGYAGSFTELAASEVQTMLDLNITALTQLTHRLAPGMVERRQGWIMNVASVVGHVPFASMPVYAPTKAFVVTFTDALRAQLKPLGIRVTCLAPGTTRTEFFDDRTWTGLRKQLMKMSMSADRVARIGVQSLARGRRCAICGKANRVFINLMHYVPKPWMLWVSQRVGQ